MQRKKKHRIKGAKYSREDLVKTFWSITQQKARIKTQWYENYNHIDINKAYLVVTQGLAWRKNNNGKALLLKHSQHWESQQMSKNTQKRWNHGRGVELA